MSNSVSTLRPDSGSAEIYHQLQPITHAIFGQEYTVPDPESFGTPATVVWDISRNSDTPVVTFRGSPKRPIDVGCTQLGKGVFTFARLDTRGPIVVGGDLSKDLNEGKSEVDNDPGLFVNGVEVHGDESKLPTFLNNYSVLKPFDLVEIGGTAGSSILCFIYLEMVNSSGDKICTIVNVPRLSGRDNGSKEKHGSILFELSRAKDLTDQERESLTRELLSVAMSQESGVSKKDLTGKYARLFS